MPVATYWYMVDTNTHNLASYPLSMSKISLINKKYVEIWGKNRSKTKLLKKKRSKIRTSNQLKYDGSTFLETSN